MGGYFFLLFHRQSLKFQRVIVAAHKGTEKKKEDRSNVCPFDSCNGNQCAIFINSGPKRCIVPRLHISTNVLDAKRNRCICKHISTVDCCWTSIFNWIESAMKYKWMWHKISHRYSNMLGAAELNFKSANRYQREKAMPRRLLGHSAVIFVDEYIHIVDACELLWPLRSKHTQAPIQSESKNCKPTNLNFGPNFCVVNAWLPSKIVAPYGKRVLKRSSLIRKRLHRYGCAANSSMRTIDVRTKWQLNLNGERLNRNTGY